MQEFLERYSRTILLNEVGFEGQKSISEFKLLVIGAGGLSSSFLPILASSGIKQFGLVEPDVVELSNLQRQFIYKAKDIGNAKVGLAASFIKGINPSVEVEIFKKPLNVKTEGEVDHLARSYNAIVDLTDSFSSRICSNRIAIKNKIPFFTGSAIGFAGHIYSFFGHYNSLPCYSCLFGEDEFLYDEAKTCANTGILPSVASIVGSLVANNVLLFISLYNKLSNIEFVKKYSKNNFILIDFLKEANFKYLTIKKDLQCKVCIQK